MPDRKPDIPPVSMSNTKKEMLDAYNELMEQLKEKRQTELIPYEKIEEKKNKEIVKTADSISTEEVVKKSAELKHEFGAALTKLAEKLENAVSQYQTVKSAVELKQNELQDIFEIQKEASSLAALIEAQKQKREAFEQEMTEKRERLDIEIQTTKEEWAKDKKQHEADLKEHLAAVEKQRKREKEEFDYSFLREKQQAKDAFEAETSAWEREWEKSKEDKIKDLDEREKAVAASETELKELREKVQKFPEELEKTVQKAVHDSTERIILENQHKEQMIQNKFEGEKQVFITRIESLDKTIKEQSQQIVKLSTQLEKSYGQVQDIAVKAVEGSAGKANLNSLSDLLKEQSRKSESKAGN